MKISFVDLKAQYYSIKDEIDKAISDVIQNSAFIGGKYAKADEQKRAVTWESQNKVIGTVVGLTDGDLS